MSAAQCPECGRFLAKEFVQNLVTAPAPCPKCGVRLSAAEFPDELGQAAAPEGADEEPAAAADLRDPVPPRTADADSSVRPPDLDPGEVRRSDDGGRDPLASWDQPGGDVVELDRFRSGRVPPPDGAIVAGAGLVGALTGALLAQRRVRGAVVGLGVGVVAGAASRQVWRLPD